MYATSDKNRCTHYHKNGKLAGKRCSQPIVGQYYCDQHAAGDPCKGCGDVLATKTTETFTLKVQVTANLANYLRSYGDEPTRETVEDWVRNLVEGVLLNDPALNENGAEVTVK